MPNAITNTVEILEDWQDSLAVYKPAGWLSVPGRGHKENVPVLSHVLGEQLRRGAQKKENDLFIVHRLDEGTSGVMIFARTPQTHRELNTLFETREVKKMYWCLVKGTPKDQTIDLPLFKLPSKRIKSVVDSKGKPSQTIITIKASQDGITLIEAQPLTGRSHQIRVHLAHLGFPLLGDSLYGGLTRASFLELTYPLLHARHISFERQSSSTSSGPACLCTATAPLKNEFEMVATSLGFVPSCGT